MCYLFWPEVQLPRESGDRIALMTPYLRRYLNIPR